MSVANSAGYVDTYRSRVYCCRKMTIPTYSNFWIDGNFYDLSGTITFNVTASMADRFAIGIDKIGVGRVVTEGCRKHIFNICEQAGNRKLFCIYECCKPRRRC